MASPPISYAAAMERVQEFLLAIPGKHPIPSETASLATASGRVLAQEIRCDRDQPPFPRATRDGFACRAEDINTRQPLRVTGRVRAGEAPNGVLEPGEAWEIMTGAPVPDGADCVLMVEHASESSGEHTGEGLISIRVSGERRLLPGENIVPQGAEAHAGDLLLSPGIRLAPPQIALAAQCGLSSLTVARRPKAVILTTGDELVPVEAIPRPGQIRNSNAPMLAALVTAAGGEPILMPAVHDNEAAIDEALDEALAGALDSSLPPDLLLISGGISAGKFDLVKDALLRAGARFHFHGVAIQPGRPVAFGQVPAGPSDHGSAEGKTEVRSLPFFALPGNPISSAVTFELFAAPILRTLAGETCSASRFHSAIFRGSWRGNPGLTRFLPSWCNFASQPALQPEVRLIPWQGSGDLAAFARSNCLTVVPEDAAELADGDPVRILMW
jgi:molybdopterin molybdotransferase